MIRPDSVVPIVASVVLSAASGASLIALFTAAVHRRLPTVMLWALLITVGLTGMWLLALWARRTLAHQAWARALLGRSDWWRHRLTVRSFSNGDGAEQVVLFIEA